MSRFSLRSNAMDMTSGPLLSKMVLYSIPIILSGLLQLLFNAADIVVVGRFTGSDALAAVSASGPISSLLVTLFMGLSVGANVLCAQYAGANQEEDFRRTVHTAFALALIVGIGLTAIGLGIASPLLRLLKTPENIFPLARLYLWIYFLGIPAMMIYNFGAAILRAVGDTRHPLYYLSFSGGLNVCLNLFFVIVLHMGVEGVAIATVISQVISAALVVLQMMRARDITRLEPRKIRVDRDKLSRMLKVGVPAGIQGSAFSISNLLIQSAINSFGAQVMAATTVAFNIDGFCYVAIDALSQAAISFTGQNYGAGNYQRIDKIFGYTLGIGTGLGILLGVLGYLFAPQLIGIYTADPQVVAYGVEIMFITCLFQFVNCTMNVPSNVVRGMGRSVFPMIYTIFCVCVLRVVWIYTVFARYPTVTVLFLSYPVTKGLASLVGIVYYFWLRKRVREQGAFAE